ncbi:MAG: magnesium transporter CorA family protein [Acetobacteraceae bacterium]|nr:magnesium transporter CorA family protein [Pseudomonadota bacterium]
MLQAFVCANGKVHRASAPATVDALRSAAWIDLESPTAAEVDLVQQATGLHVPTEAEISEIETSSRLANREGVLYLSMPLISTLTELASLVSAGFVLSQQQLITVRFAPSRTFKLYSDSLQVESLRNGTPAHVLVGLLEAIVDRGADILEQMRRDAEAISHTIFALSMQPSTGRKNEDAALRRILGELGRLGDLGSHARETLVGVARIAPFVEGTAADWLPSDLPPRLATLRQDVASISDFGTHLGDKQQFLLDATLGFINIAQNNVMKVMAIASVVGIPPVLIAGVYGMNFKIIPELNWTWGYAYAWGLIILSALIPTAMFRWWKWI